MCSPNTEECLKCKFNIYCNTKNILITLVGSGLEVARTGGGYCKSTRQAQKED